MCFQAPMSFSAYFLFQTTEYRFFILFRALRKARTHLELIL